MEYTNSKIVYMLEKSKIIRLGVKIINGWLRGEMEIHTGLKIPIKDFLNEMLPENKLSVEFPTNKSIIIFDENPKYKTIARDAFIKANNLYVPRDTISAKVIGKIPYDNET